MITNRLNMLKFDKNYHRSSTPLRTYLINGLSQPMAFLSKTVSAALNKRCTRREAGFTLLELLVVLAILALLIGMVAPAVLKQLGGAKHKIAQQSVERLTGILDLYKLDVGSYPTTDQGLQALITKPDGVEGWNGPYLKDGTVPTDPWNKPLVYRSPSSRPGHDYDLFSLGADGREGGTGENEDVYNK